MVDSQAHDSFHLFTNAAGVRLLDAQDGQRRSAIVIFKQEFGAELRISDVNRGNISDADTGFSLKKAIFLNTNHFLVRDFNHGREKNIAPLQAGRRVNRRSHGDTLIQHGLLINFI